MRAFLLLSILALSACATPYDRAEGQRLCDQGRLAYNARPAAYLACLDAVDAETAYADEERREQTDFFLSLFGLN